MYRWRMREKVGICRTCSIRGYCDFQKVNLNIWLSVKGLTIENDGISSKSLNGTHGKVSPFQASGEVNRKAPIPVGFGVVSESGTICNC